MKTIAILTRANALKLQRSHPEAKVLKYDTAKYNWHGTQTHYVGRELEVHENIVAIWCERRSDKDGPFTQFMCLTANPAVRYNQF